MATSYEKRHQPDEMSYHKRPSGAQAFPIGSLLLLEDDTNTPPQQSILLLEEDAGAQIDGLFLEDQP
jgi:hypothetical protein